MVGFVEFRAYYLDRPDPLAYKALSGVEGLSCMLTAPRVTEVKHMSIICIP